MKLTEKELKEKLSWLNKIRETEKGNLLDESINYLEELDAIYSASAEQLADVYKQRKMVQEILEKNDRQEDLLLEIMNNILNYQEDELFGVNKVNSLNMESKSTETAATLADIKYDIELMLYYMIRSSKDLKVFITIGGKQFMATCAVGGVIDFNGIDESFSSKSTSDERMLDVFKGADEIASELYNEKVSKYRNRIHESLDELCSLLFESIWNLTPSGKKGASFTVGTLPASSKRLGNTIAITAGANEWTIEQGKPFENIVKTMQVLEEMEKQLQDF